MDFVLCIWSDHALYLNKVMKISKRVSELLISWLVVWGSTALWDNISVYIGTSPKEREKEERRDR